MESRRDLRLDPDLPRGLFEGVRGVPRTFVLSTPAMVADVSSFCPVPRRGSLEIYDRESRQQVSMNVAIELLRDYHFESVPDRVEIFFIIATTGCLFAPAKTGAALSALCCRILADPFTASREAIFSQPRWHAALTARLGRPCNARDYHEAIGQEVWLQAQRELWREVAGLMFAAGYWERSGPSVSREEAVGALTGQKARELERAFEILDAEGIEFARQIVLKKTIMAKLDEVLCPKLHDGHAGLKPRAIVVFNPVAHGITTQAFRTLAESMHSYDEPDSKLLRFGDYSVELLFGSGRNPQTFNRLAQHMRDRALNPVPRLLSISVCGDDSLAVHGDLELGNNVIESDVTQCDQSHTEATFGYLFQGFERHHHDPEPVGDDQIGHLGEMVALQCRGSFQEEKYKRESVVNRRVPVWLEGSMEVQLATGLTATTTSNTNIVGALVVMALLRASRGRFQLENFQYEALLLGFRLKASRGHIDHSTFLKSWFVPSLQGAIAVPIPGWVVKVGKLLTDPHDLYPHLPAAERASYVAYALAQGLLIPDWYPILGPFVAALRRAGQAHEVPKKVHARLHQDHRPYDLRALDPSARQHVLDLVMDRYKVSVDWVTEVEALLNSVVRVPVMVSHPLFVRMACRDYGDDEYSAWCEGTCNTPFRN